MSASLRDEVDKNKQIVNITDLHLLNNLLTHVH